MKNNRRDFIRQGAALTAALSVTGLNSVACSETKDPNPQNMPLNKVSWPVTEGPDTPKIILASGSNDTTENMRMLKQIGADYILMGGPQLPWTEKGLRSIMDRFMTEGLTVLNMMLPGMSGIIYNRPGRDEEIRQIQDSVRAAGAVGLPIIEYNFYAHRLIEGYYPVAGRGGAGYLAYDYNRTDTVWQYPAARSNEESSSPPKELKPLSEIGSYTYEQLWANISYFLKAVIPVAEKAGVRMALHPNDPPVPVSRGSYQIMGSFSDWKKFVDIVDSPSNGMTYDCGVSNELGENPLEVLDYLISRDRINHVHYRNCIVETPRLKYTEVFPDNGTVDMFAVMEQLIKRKYKYGIYPEHPRELDYDKMNPGGGSYAGWVYTTAYCRAMMQAALTLEKRQNGQ